MRDKFVCLIVAAFVVSQPAAAETINLSATLATSTTVTPNNGTGDGEGRFSYDTLTKQFSYSVRYQGLSGSATAADIREPGQVNRSGPIIVHFYVPESPINGTATLTDEQANALLTGHLYVEVDTSAHQDGEIRGQIHR